MAVENELGKIGTSSAGPFAEGETGANDDARMQAGSSSEVPPDGSKPNAVGDEVDAAGSMSAFVIVDGLPSSHVARGKGLGCGSSKALCAVPTPAGRDSPAQQGAGDGECHSSAPHPEQLPGALILDGIASLRTVVLEDHLNLNAKLCIVDSILSNYKKLLEHITELMMDIIGFFNGEQSASSNQG